MVQASSSLEEAENINSSSPSPDGIPAGYYKATEAVSVVSLKDRHNVVLLREGLPPSND